MRSKLEKKDLYTVEDLLNHKLSYKEREEKLLYSLCDIMCKMVGKDFYWAKEHDLEDLHINELIVMDKKTHDEFETIGVNILKKQLGVGKKMAQREFSYFMFAVGFCYYTDDDNENSFTSLECHKRSVRWKIGNYEDKNGELKYPDGWEKELKEWCEYVRN